jgi:hypothetical protein
LIIYFTNTKIMTATLIIAYNGYFNIELIEKLQFKWFVRICGNGKEIEVFEDEFILD